LETSALEAINVEKAFQNLIQGKRIFYIEIYGKFHKELEETPDEFNIKEEKVIDLNEKSNNLKKKQCCK
jgi:hypothetical protein